MTSQTATMSSVAVGRRSIPFRTSPSARRTGSAMVVSAVSKKEQSSLSSGAQKVAQVAMSVAAAHLMTLPFAGAAFATLPGGLEVEQPSPADNENRDFGPNEVTKDKIGEISLDADNPFDTAAPGRAGQTFGEEKPGQGDVGAVNEGEIKEGALKASSLFEKIKGVLPFQTLPVFELADLDKDTKDFGPNEVSKKVIEDTSVSANNPFDKAAPGRSGQVFGQQKPGQGDVGAVDAGKVAEKALSGSSVVDKVKSALPFQTLPVFDLSVAPDDKNLGPNEVGKDVLSKLPGADNKFDTATPGRAGEKAGDLAKAGAQNAKDALDSAPEGPKGAFDAIKNAFKQ